MFGVPPPMATPMAPPPTTTTKEPPPTANDLFSPPKKGTTELFKGGTPRMGEPPPEQQPVEADPFAEPEGAGPAPTDLSGLFAQQQTTEPPPPQTEEVVAAQPEEQQTAIEGGGDEAAAAGLEESPWVVGYTEEGHQYWYNNLTGESSWYDPNIPQEGVVGGDEGGGEYAATEQQYDYSQQPQPDAQQQPQQYDLRSPFGVELPLGVQIDVSGTLSSQEALSALRDFPGPLPDGSQGYTPPALLGYAEATTQQMDGIYYNGESEPLLWRLLSLLCKHDGVLDGSTGDASASELLQALRGGEGAGGTPLTGGPADPAAQQAAALKFESLLLDGKRQAACDLAMESGMWADALLLSSHMDAETWRLVMAKFAESTLAAGSPLRTLYGLFAGNGTAVFKDGAEGNGSSEPPARMVSQWRDNLAMMLANPTAGDTEVIAHLGDEVWRHHGVAAAHCCYLLAELPPDDKRMVLVGHDHNATPSLSSSSEGWSNPTLLAVQSIQATEIYCHLRGKASADFVPPGRSPFELLYAHLLFEAGEAHKSAAYTDKLISQIDGPLWDVAASNELEALRGRLAAAGIELHGTAPQPPAVSTGASMGYSGLGAHGVGEPAQMPALWASESVRDLTAVGAQSSSQPSQLDSFEYSAPSQSIAEEPAPPPPQPVPTMPVQPVPTKAVEPAVAETPYVPTPFAPPQKASRAAATPASGVRSRYTDPFATPMPEKTTNGSEPAQPEPPKPTPMAAAPASAISDNVGGSSSSSGTFKPPPFPGGSLPGGEDDNKDMSLGGGGGGGKKAAEEPASAGGGWFSSIAKTAIGSVSKAFEKKSSQLEDFEEFVYNAEFKAWMPKSADPAKWAAENLAGPPPPPKSSSAAATPSNGGGGGGGDGGGGGGPPGGGMASSAPQTPMPDRPGGPGTMSAPATGGGQFSGGNSLRSGGARGRPNPRSRYVDTFNTGGGDDAAAGGKADSELMPPPASRPARPKPTFFTPSKPAGAAADGGGGGGGATPLFMTPTADVYAGAQVDEPAADAGAGGPPQ